MDRKSFARLRVFPVLRLLAWPLVTLLAGTALTAAVVTRTVSDNAQVVQERAQRAVDGVMVQVDTLLQRYRYGLIAVRGVIAVTGADRIDRATFLRYSQTRDYAVEFPGARGFGFIRRLPAAQLDSYLASQRGNGWPDFTVRQFQPHAGEREIIELIEPIATNRAAIGLDIASDPVRRAGAAAASASGTATLTAPIALVQDSPRRQQSFLLLLPVYAGAGSRTVIGWAFAPLAIDAVLDRMPGELPDGAFTLTDRAPGSAPVQFYATATGIPAHGTVHRSRRVLGRDWTATFQPSQAFVAALRLPAPRDAGLAGAALTVLAAALGAMLAAQRARRQRLVATVQSLNATLERQVAARTGELEAALRENDVLVRTINDQMLYSVTDAQGIILEVNDNFCAAYGYRRDALIGVHYSFLSSGQHDRTFWADMRDAVMAGRTWNGTVCNQAVDGTLKWFDTVVAPYFNEHGVIERYVALHTDVTTRHAVDVALRESTLRAEQASIAKSQFVANMSHEIRTPMNAMLGMLELTLRTELSARQRDYVDKARSAGATLLALLNDVLDFSKIDAGKLELDCQAFSVDGLLGDLAAVLTGNHVNQDVEVMFDLSADVPGRLHGDCQRLVQVMVNLAGNALKFTQAGTIVVGIAVLDASAGTMRFSVSDTGIGIPAGQLDMIFDGFTQAEASTARRFGGTGLGLAISARIVALMGGKLEVASAVGEGSRFWFDIVLATATDDTVVPPALAARRALVVANARSGPMLQRLVERTGVQAVLAHEASAASVLAAACDVVLMDGDGAAAGDADGIALPLILLTAHAGDALRAAWPGCAVLGKPVTPAELRCALTRALAPPGAASLTVPSHRPRRLDGLRLLVVEDNALNRQVAFELLASEGALVDLADGGQQGVDMATDPARTYDAVIMDVQMPDVDGIEATHRIRAVQKSAHLPIMAMTANASTADRDACLAAGMNSHIGKPFDIDEVVARVRGLVERHGTPPPPAVMAVTGDELIDLAGALPRFLDDAGLYAHLLGNFERESGELLARLEREQAQGDTRAEAATLHALKGMALTMGAQRLARDLGGPAGSQRSHGALRTLAAASVRAARAGLAQLVRVGASSL